MPGCQLGYATTGRVVVGPAQPVLSPAMPGNPRLQPGQTSPKGSNLITLGLFNIVSTGLILFLLVCASLSFPKVPHTVAAKNKSPGEYKANC